MAKYGTYYGNLGKGWTSLTDEYDNAASQVAPQASFGSYAGAIGTKKPRVNSFDNNSNPQEYNPLEVGFGTKNRDSISNQRGVRAASQDYERLKSQEVDIVDRITIDGASAKNAAAARRNSLAVSLDRYNSNLSSSLRTAGRSFNDNSDLVSAPGVARPLGGAFRPDDISDFDGVDDSVRSELSAALAALTPEELEAASPEFKIWANQFGKFGVSQNPMDYGAAGLQRYMSDLESAGIMNRAYVNRTGSEYNGPGVVDDNSRIGSSFNWADIDSDFLNGFLPNSGLNLDENRLIDGQSPYPLSPRITSRAVYNPFTNSPVETSLNGASSVFIDNLGQYQDGFQWGQGMFSTPMAPYYSTGYGDRFKSAPTGQGPPQWESRPSDFSSKEIVPYVPETSTRTKQMRVAGNLADPIEQRLAIGQRETFSRENQVPAPSLVENSVVVNDSPEISLPSVFGERTVDLGNIGAGFGSYRLTRAGNQRPQDDYFGVYDNANNIAYNAGPSVGLRQPGLEHYVESSGISGNAPYNVRATQGGQRVASIGSNDLRFLFEGFR